MSDPRFARLTTDPRFRRPKQKKLKVELDDRFKEVLQGEEFAGETSAAGKRKTDKYGRPVAKSHHKDQLKQFYRLRSPSPSAGESGETGFVDYARGEGLLESSGSEDEGDEESDIEEEVEMGPAKASRIPGQVAESSDEDDSEAEEGQLNINLSEDEEDVTQPSAFDKEDLDALDADGQAEEPEEDFERIPPTSRFAVVNMDWDNMRAIDLYTVFSSILSSYQPAESSRSKKKDEDLRKNEIVPKGTLLHVKVFPSQFGKERMEKEELAGPSADLFVKTDVGKKGKGKQVELKAARNGSNEAKRNGGGKKAVQFEPESEEEEEYDDMEDEMDEFDEDEDLGEGDDLDDLASDAELGSGEEDFDDEFEGEGGEDDVLGKVRYDSGEESENDYNDGDVDMDKLRNYQLERLRYFYAIATFSDPSAASYVFHEINGTEFERTANIFDLSYVPDGMDFDDEPRDEAETEMKGYKGNDFVTDALRHSNVKLTWDQDDPNRNKVLRKTLTKAEIEEDDFKTYLASSSDESEEELADEEDVEQVSKKEKKKKAKEKTEKLRALLLGGGSDDEDVWGKHGGRGLPDMEDGDDRPSGDMEITFKAGLSGAIGNAADDEDLSTLQKYQRRMKEKKDRKKEKKELKIGSRAEKDEAEREGFDDDFFSGAEDEPVINPSKDDKAGKKGKKDKEPENKASTKVKPVATDDQLAALLPNVDEAKHFSMQDIVRAEKDAGKKKRKRSKKNKEKEAELGDEAFKVDVRDDRFKAIYDEPEFAIDPSNPRFVKTKNMSTLLEEGTKRRHQKQPPSNGLSNPSRKLDTGFATAAEPSVNDLVANLKRKAGGEANKVEQRDGQDQPKKKRKRTRH